MKLGGIFSGDTPKAEGGQTVRNTPAANQLLNRQIRSLVPGQTLQGELVGRSGNEVQIKVADDMVLNARLDRNMNLEIGQNMTFEVKNNGRMLTLSPLFTNVATDANVLKALDMAALPINEGTVSMTSQMMEAGLSVSRQSLQQVFREINSFPQAESGDIINLHKLGMPVNEANVNQMVSYRNLTHQLIDGMNDVFGTLPGALHEMLENGDITGALKLYQGLLEMAQESGALPEMGEGAEAQIPVPAEDGLPGEAGASKPEGIVGTGSGIKAENLLKPEAEILTGTGTQAEEKAENNSQIPASRVVVTVEELPVSGEGGARNVLMAGANEQPINQLIQDLTAMLEEAVQDGKEAGDYQALAKNLNQLQQMIDAGEGGSAHAAVLLKAVLGDKGGQKLLAQKLHAQWTLRPEDVAKKGEVEELYHKLDKQVKGLMKLLEDTGQTSQAVYRGASNLSQNLDFLQQLNQAYTYVQLPLRLQQGEAHGDLYVYTNRKNLSAKDGQVSALLHLDMEHLGPVDVYVAMQNEKVSTKFYVQDDEMLDFLGAHMDILTERLARRGYDCTFGMQVRGEGADTENVVKQILQQGNQVPLAQYAFDVRA